MKLLLATLILGPLVASAVDTKKCPEKLSFTYESVRSLSDRELSAVVEKANTDVEHTMKRAIPERDAFANAAYFTYQEVELSRVPTRTSGVCVYMDGRKQNGDNETRLFTRGGKDLLRVAINSKTKSFWTYHTVKAYSKKSISVVSLNSPVYGLFDHGNPWLQVGWANDVGFDVSAE